MYKILLGDNLKKIVILTFLSLLILTSTACFNNKNKDKEEKEVFDDTYIEEIPENSKIYIENLDNEILKTSEEIESINKEIFEKSGTMFDLKNIKEVSKDKILSYINSYSLPSVPKYNDDKIVSKEDKENILANRNLEQVKTQTEIKRGIIVKRANLRSFPTNIHFYDLEGVENFDSIQETELLVNTEVIILNESKDKNWYFVLSPTYYGWVLKENIAPLSLDDRNYFIEPNDFIIVTNSSIKVNDLILDMSVKLPYLGTNKDGYLVSIPIKNKDGALEKETITLKRNEAHIGYLDYTKRNVIIESFKYEGVPYSWSGLNQNVDCSSYVANIYRTFGFNFPRNTKDQNKSVGNIIDLSNKTANQKLEILKGKAPALLYQQGHVMIYLGDINNKHYIIHASGELKNMKVLVSLLNDSSYLQKINRINTL